jgi:hypothetical protein
MIVRGIRRWTAGEWGSVLPPRMGACLLVLNEKVSGSLLSNSTKGP